MDLSELYGESTLRANGWKKNVIYKSIIPRLRINLIDNTTIFILAQSARRILPFYVNVSMSWCGRRSGGVLFAVYTSFWALHKSILAAQSLKLLAECLICCCSRSLGEKRRRNDDNGFREVSRVSSQEGRKKGIRKTFLYSEIKRFTIFFSFVRKGINCQAATRDIRTYVCVYVCCFYIRHSTL